MFYNSIDAKNNQGILHDFDVFDINPYYVVTHQLVFEFAFVLKKKQSS